MISLLTFAAAPQRALAHAGLVRSEPANEAQVKSVSRVDLWFNELLEDGFNTVVVTPSTKSTSTTGQPENLVRGKPVIDPKDQTHVSVKLPPLPPGAYVVQWRVLSRDGHSAPGQIRFNVSGAASEEARK